MSKGLHSVVANKGNDNEALSSKQKQILDLLTVEFETPKRIATRLEITHQAVYKIIGKLRKKGYLTRGYTRGLQKIRPTTPLQPSKSLKNGIRLHGQEFNIQILRGSKQYQDALNNKNLFYLDDNTVRLYKGSIEVYANPHRCFLGEDAQRATSLSIQYWNRIFNQLESRLNIIIVKGENTRIKQVNGHYAEINNELAEDCNEKKAKIRIYGKDDGKLWFVIDNSFNMNEAEAVHPKTAKEDIQNVKRFFDDIRENNPPTISEIVANLNETIRLQKETALQHKETAHGLLALTNFLNTMFQQNNLQTHTEKGIIEVPDYIN